MVESRRSVFDEFRYVPVVACVLLVALRLCIGWQFLYEGLWKYDTLDGTQPWTAAGYLKNAHGPFRDLFRGMSGDPDELQWLDQKYMEASWDAWAEDFSQHYGLDANQQAQLQEMLGGPEDYRAALDALPAGVKIPNDLKDVIRFDDKANRLIVNGEKPLMPSEREELLDLAPLPAEVTDANRAEVERIRAYRTAVEQVADRSSRISYKDRLAVALGPDDPDRVRHLFANFKGTIGDHAPESIDQFYRDLLADYQARLERANQTDLAFQRDHLAMEWEEIQELRGELVNPVKALDAQLKEEALTLLTRDQLQRGPVPQPWTTQRIVDVMTIVALGVLGFLLIAGLATRAAAIAGAGMVLSFYLVWPPWPGVPEAIGPEHAYIVNKNLIEVVALLALAALPTGQWFGLDGLIYRGWRRLKGRRRTGPAAQAVPAKTASEPKPAIAPVGR